MELGIAVCTVQMRELRPEGCHLPLSHAQEVARGLDLPALACMNLQRVKELEPPPAEQKAPGPAPPDPQYREVLGPWTLRSAAGTLAAQRSRRGACQSA